MKRFLFITILAAICGLSAVAQDKSVVTHQTTGGRDRYDVSDNLTITPQLEYSADEKEIYVTCGEGICYDVVVATQQGQQPVFMTTVCGPYDSFNVAMLASGKYTVTLTSGSVQMIWIFDPTTGFEISNMSDEMGVGNIQPSTSAIGLRRHELR